MQIKGFVYRLNGHMASRFETPSGAAVMYHVECFPFFERTDYSGFPVFARDAAVDYCRTMRALLTSGF